MGSYEEALARQQGRQYNKAVQFKRKDSVRRLISIPCWAKPDMPKGHAVFVGRDNKGQYVPVAHITPDGEAGDLLAAQRGFVPIPEKMEIANDS